jgi:hypothetical protein
MICKPRLSSLSLTAAILIGLMSATGWAQAPKITSTSPQAVRPGQSVGVTIRGTNLANATQLWTSFTGKATLALTNGRSNTATQAIFIVTVPAGTAPGIHGIRVATPKGISALKLFVVDDLPTVTQVKNNTTFSTAQEIKIPTAVDGTVAALQRNYYRFKAAAGQTLSFEVLARRIGSPLDPVIRVLKLNDFGATELGYNDDALGLMGDSQFSYRFQTAGEYLVEVRDIQYKGGGTHRYRLRIGDFPCVTTAYPMGAQPGSQTTISFAGSDINNVVPVKFTAPKSGQVSAVQVAAKRKGGKSSGFAVVTIGKTANKEFLEKEPNNTFAKATPAELGGNLNGRFLTAGDVDHFGFTAKKGQKFSFTAVTRSQGSPADLLMRLLNAKGAKLVEAEDTGTQDGVLTYTFPADGKYFLAVEDLHQRGGQAFAYRVDVSSASPGFALTATADHVNIPAGGTAAVIVKAIRKGYNGPITLKVTGLPAGITSIPTVIGPGRNSAFVTLTSSVTAKPGPVSAAQLVGTGTVGKSTITAAADISTALKASAAGIPWAPQTLANAFAVGLAPAAPLSFKTSVAKTTVAQGKTVKFKVTVNRSKTMTEAITLAFTPLAKKNPEKGGLPAGITIAMKPIPKGKNEIELVITTTKKAPKGTFTATLIGTHKKGKAATSQNVPGITITVQ